MRILFKIQDLPKKSWDLYSSVFDYCMGAIYSKYVKPVDWIMGKLQVFAKRTQTDKRLRKSIVMIIESIGGAIFAGLTLWLSIQEKGSGILSNPIFLMLILSWAYIALFLLLNKWTEMKDKTTDEKIDDLTKSINTLISEIRQDRDDRHNQSNHQPPTQQS